MNSADQKPLADLPQSCKHLPALDGFRGVCITLVLLFSSYHIFNPEPAGVLSSALLAACSMGWVGVDMFFVLSGFLITGILLDSKGRDGYFRNFYARRALRIFPLYFGFLVGFFVLLRPLARGYEAYDYLWDNQHWFWFYLQNIWISALGHWPQSGLLDHFWSLAIEEQFYLVWPAVIWAVARNRIHLFCWLAILIAAGYRAYAVTHGIPASTIYVLTLSRMGSLAMGAGLAVIIRSPRGSDFVKRYANRVLLGAATVLILFVAWRRGLPVYDPVVQSIGYDLLGVFFTVLLAASVLGNRQNRMARVLLASPLRYLGKVSYGVYVFHVPLMKGLNSVLTLPRPLALAEYAVFAVLSIIASIALAGLSWRWFETPILGLKRFFPRVGTPLATKTSAVAIEPPSSHPPGC